MHESEDSGVGLNFTVLSNDMAKRISNSSASSLLCVGSEQDSEREIDEDASSAQFGALNPNAMIDSNAEHDFRFVFFFRFM